MPKYVAIVLVILVLLVAGCGGSPTEAPAVAPTATAAPPTVAPTNTPVPPTATPVPPTAAPTDTPAAAAPSIPHPIAGMESQCLTCHGPGGDKPVPADHDGRPVDSCTTCHMVDDGAQSGTPPAGVSVAPRIPHAIVAPQDQCLTCHATGGLKPFPANHAAFTVDNCQTCHQPEG